MSRIDVDWLPIDELREIACLDELMSIARELERGVGERIVMVSDVNWLPIDELREIACLDELMSIARQSERGS